MYSHTTTPTTDKVLNIPYMEEVSDILAWEKISEKNTKNKWKIVSNGIGRCVHAFNKTVHDV